jgi:hypothetical protein
MFVEYTAGGVWNVWTSCDSDQSGALCFWQAEIYVHDGAIDSFEGNELEEFDSVSPTQDGGLSVYFETGSFSDAVTFTTEPGALVEMVVALDGVTAPQYFVWYGNDEVQDGAPRSPVVFQPDAP